MPTPTSGPRALSLAALHPFPHTLPAPPPSRLSLQTTAQLCNNPKPCRYGDRCMFAHNLEEARLFREAHGSSWQQRPQSGEHEGSASARWQAQGGAAAGQAQDRDQPFCHPARYKTLLCNYFERRGDCRFGASCNFAHGARELRPEPVFPHPSSSFYQRNGSGGDGTFRRESAPEPPAYGLGPEEYDSPEPPALPAAPAAPAVVGGGPQEWDAEVLASAAAAAVPVGEAYAAQQQHDRAQQGQQQAGSQSRPAVRAGGPAAATPYLASRDEFPALGGAAVPAGARGKGAACAAGVAGAAGGGRQATRPWCDMSSGSSSPLSGDASKCPSFEWDGNTSPGGSAPLTVCFSEDNLRCHTASVGTASGSSRACSVRSGGGEWEVPTAHSTAHINTSHTVASRLGPSPAIAPAAAAEAVAVAAPMAAAAAAASAAVFVAGGEEGSEERGGDEAGTEVQGEEAEEAVAFEAEAAEVAGEGGAEEEQAAAAAAAEEEEEEAGEVYAEEEQAQPEQAEQQAAAAQAVLAVPVPLPRKLAAAPAVVYFDATSAQGHIPAAAAASARQLPPPVPAMLLPRVSLPPPGFPATPAAAPQLGAGATPAAVPAAVAPSPPAPTAPAPAAPCQPQPHAKVVAGGAAADARSALWERVTRAGGVDLSLVPSFICPITHRPFHNPVVAADGITYEKDEITDWLYRQNKEVSPVTGQLLPHRLLLPNEAVRRAMGEVAELIRALAI